MRSKWIVVCLALAAFFGTIAGVRSDQLIIKDQTIETKCHPVGPSAEGYVPCTVTVQRGHMSTVYSKQGHYVDFNSVDQAIAEKTAEMVSWLNKPENSFRVYTTDEVYAKNEVYDRETIDDKVTQIYALIDSNLKALRVSETDKQAILEAVKVSMQPTIAELEKTLADQITQSVLGQLKEAGVLQ